MSALSSQKRRYTSLILVLSLVLPMLYINCTGWYDDGEAYLCPECAEFADVHSFELAPCARCQENMTRFYYCYDCAKELDCCMRCRRER